MWKFKHVSFVVAFISTLAVSQSVVADTAEQFYNGKRITIIASAGAGGGYDLYTRLLARHMARHLPDTTIIVQNMGEAGGQKAANYLYNVAPRDGTTLALLRTTLAVSQMIRPTGIKYDAAKFNWIGSMADMINVILVYKPTSPAKSLAEAKQKQVVMGAGGKGGEGYIQPKIMNALLGTKFKIVLGYRGVSEVDVAISRGEVHGRQGAWSALKTKNQHWLRDDKLAFLAQVGLRKHPELPDIPRLIDLAKNAEDRKIMEFLSSPAALGRSVAAPPGVPAERVSYLQAVFAKTMSDPDFLSDSRKRNVEIAPVSGDEISKMVKSAMNIPRPLVARAKELLEY